MNDFYNKDEYSEDDIKSLIANEMEEDIYLEFKDGRALGKEDKKKNEISKDVSAFANSDGGIIIYGIEEKNHKANNVSIIDGDEFTKEWLEQIIHSKIHRKIQDVRIFPIRVDDDIKKSIYVVKIPVTSRAPHQASDKKYYRRYNFQSVPMEEYEVRNLYARILPAKLELLEPIFKDVGSSHNMGNIRNVSYEVGFRVKNSGNTIEKDYKIEIHLPTILQNFNQTPILEYLTFEDDEFRVYSVPNSSPIFQNETTTICYTTYSVDASAMKKLSDCIMKIKLFFTAGTVEKEYKLLELLEFEGEPLSLKRFGV